MILNKRMSVKNKRIKNKRIPQQIRSKYKLINQNYKIQERNLPNRENFNSYK